MGQNHIECYLKEAGLIFAGTPEELAKMAPEWTGGVNVGDIATVNGVKRKIKEIEIKYADSEDEDTIIKLHIE